MGLSRENKTDISTLQVITDLALGIRELLDNPKALEKAAKDAYALPETEKAFAQEARDKIAEYKGLIAQNEAQKEQIGQWMSDLDKEKTAFQVRVDGLEKRLADLAKKEADFAETKRNTLALADETKALNVKLADKETKLQAWEERLGVKQAQIEAKEADLNARIEKMRQLAGEK